jgi:hypothetical protein
MDDEHDIDMPFMVLKGYEDGTRYVESLLGANVVPMVSQSFPDNRDPDYVRGVDGAFYDYVQDNEVSLVALVDAIRRQVRVETEQRSS